MPRDQISMEIKLKALGKLEQQFKTMDFKDESDREKVIHALHKFCNENSVLSQTLEVNPMVDVKGLVGWVDKIFPPNSAKAKAPSSTQEKKKPKKEKQVSIDEQLKKKQVSIDEQFADLEDGGLDFI